MYGTVNLTTVKPLPVSTNMSFASAQLAISSVKCIGMVAPRWLIFRHGGTPFYVRIGSSTTFV
jgi:hypothetical protein